MVTLLGKYFQLVGFRYATVYLSPQVNLPWLQNLITIEAYPVTCIQIHVHVKGAVHDFMGDFDVLHLVFCLAYMHKSAFID